MEDSELIYYCCRKCRALFTNIRGLRDHSPDCNGIQVLDSDVQQFAYEKDYLQKFVGCLSTCQHTETCPFVTTRTKPFADTGATMGETLTSQNQNLTENPTLLQIHTAAQAPLLVPDPGSTQVSVQGSLMSPTLPLSSPQAPVAALYSDPVVSEGPFPIGMSDPYQGTTPASGPVSDLNSDLKTPATSCTLPTASPLSPVEVPIPSSDPSLPSTSVPDAAISKGLQRIRRLFASKPQPQKLEELNIENQLQISQSTETAETRMMMIQDVDTPIMTTTGHIYEPNAEVNLMNGQQSLELVQVVDQGCTTGETCVYVIEDPLGSTFTTLPQSVSQQIPQQVILDHNLQDLSVILSDDRTLGNMYHTSTGDEEYINMNTQLARNVGDSNTSKGMHSVSHDNNQGAPNAKPQKSKKCGQLKAPKVTAMLPVTPLKKYKHAIPIIGVDNAVTNFYVCDICEFKSIHPNSFMGHMKMHEEESLQRGNGKDPTTRFQCGRCSFRCGEESTLKRHHKQTHNKLYKCPTCPREYPSRGGLDRHECQHKGKSDKIKSCPVKGCRYTTSHKWKLKAHQSMKHAPKKGGAVRNLHCKSCSFQTTSSKRLVKHNASHFQEEQEKKYFCDQCQYSCTQSSTLVNHIMQHQAVNPWECIICGHRDTLKSQILKHVRTKHKDGSAPNPRDAVANLGLKVDINVENYRNPRHKGIPVSEYAPKHHKAGESVDDGEPSEANRMDLETSGIDKMEVERPVINTLEVRSGETPTEEPPDVNIIETQLEHSDTNTVFVEPPGVHRVQLIPAGSPPAMEEAVTSQQNTPNTPDAVLATTPSVLPIQPLPDENGLQQVELRQADGETVFLIQSEDNQQLAGLGPEGLVSWFVVQESDIVSEEVVNL